MRMKEKLPELLSFCPGSIPDTLKKTPRWAPWRARWAPERKKFDKVPMRVDNPQYGLSTSKPDQWSAFLNALAVYDLKSVPLAGLGYCMTGAHGVTGIDLDNCVDDGHVAPWAREIVDRLGSYTELSPSGKGLRIMGLGSVPADWSNHDVGIELYGGNEARFLTITGQVLPGSPADLKELDPAALDELTWRYAKEKRKADVIDIGIPDIIDELLLPDLAALPLPERVKTFLATGECDRDRSGLIFATGVALFSLGYSDAEVFSLLASNHYVFAVAMEHRRQDADRALLYIWREHCHKAKGKAQNAVALPEEFDIVESDGPDMPPFKRDGKGKIEATIDNVAMAVRRADLCGMVIGWDQFRDEIMFCKYGEKDAWRTFRDADYSRLRIKLEKSGFKPIGRELIRDVVLLVADDQPFDSAILWLESLEWDGISRIENFFRDYFGVIDTEYTREASLYTWTAMAGRVLSPGIKADMVPILIGTQGTIKSSSIAALVPSWDFFTEVNFHEKEDDLARKMRGRLVAEIAELQGLHSRDLESIKAFLTRTHENWVPKYREFATTYARRHIFFGTTNQHEFLADETGNRRFLPLKVTRADIDAVTQDRLQLWAEARELFGLRGVCFRRAEELAKEVHAEHMIGDPWAEEIARWLNEPDLLTGVEPQTREFLQVNIVAREALRIEARQFGRREELRIGKVLRALGYEKAQRKVNKVNLKVWVKCL